MPKAAPRISKGSQYTAELKASAPRATTRGAGDVLFRVFWGRHRGRVLLTFNFGGINHQSVVLVTASEGDDGNTTNSPQRFVGAANIRVENIAPTDGRVVFVVSVVWVSPLAIWTDIVIVAGFPQGFIRA